MYEKNAPLVHTVGRFGWHKHHAVQVKVALVDSVVYSNVLEKVR